LHCRCDKQMTCDCMHAPFMPITSQTITCVLCTFTTASKADLLAHALLCCPLHRLNTPATSSNTPMMTPCLRSWRRTFSTWLTCLLLSQCQSGPSG
jgi:hypothetical protein